MNSGKEEIANRVVEAIRASQGKSAESIPISLTRKEDHTPTKESRVEKSSVANITVIKNVTVNKTQQPKENTSTQTARFIVWMNF
jgi:hypothetical protein